MSSECMHSMERSREAGVLIGLGLFTAAAIVLYWAVWFMAPQLVQSHSPADQNYPVYMAFEKAFLLADVWLAAASVTGVVGLCKMKPWGLLFMILAAGAAIFLGLLDLLFDLQHGIFSSLNAASLIELIIVSLLLIFGPVVIHQAWRLWQSKDFRHEKLSMETIQRRPEAVLTAMAQLPKSEEYFKRTGKKSLSSISAAC